jgi:hypothetical protein
MAGIDSLRQLVPPPAAPFEAPDKNWEAVEAKLGVTLPRDLFELIATYGSGWFRGSDGHAWYRIENPCSKGFLSQVKAWQATYADLKANGVYAPFPSDLYPADPGLLCIGFGESPIALFLSFRDRKPDGTVVALTYQRQWLRASSGLVPFFVAALRGDVDLSGVPGSTVGVTWTFDPDSPTDPAAFPPLLEAARLGDATQVRTLASTGADLNRGSADGYTPLCSVDDEAMVRLLLDLGADPNQADGMGRTPLTVACAAELPLGGLRALLEAGADPNRPDSSGFTPLWWACKYRNLEEIRLLLQFGADPNRAVEDGRTPMQAARKRPEVQAALRTAGAE